MDDILIGLARLTHAFAAALWMGSTFYSATQLHPRTPKIIEDPEQAEYYLLSITHGNRYRVITAMFVVIISGILLWIWVPAAPQSEMIRWLKPALMSLTVGAFIYTSWVLYPRRIFANIDQISQYRRHNTIARWIMLSTVAINFGLGIILHHF